MVVFQHLHSVVVGSISNMVETAVPYITCRCLPDFLVVINRIYTWRNGRFWVNLRR